MRIEEDIKLDYADVLFRPKRSTLHSRKDVKLKRTYKFKYSNNEWSGIPIMAANMDGVGELGIAEKLSEFQMITCLTKQHDVKKIKTFKTTIEVSGDKSLSIRWVLFSSLANGTSTAKNLLKSEDVIAALKVIKKFGIKSKINKENEDTIEYKAKQQDAFYGTGWDKRFGSFAETLRKNGMEF